MLFRRRRKRSFWYTLSIVFGLVLVWRGIWHLFDVFELMFLKESSMWAALASIVVGLFILYVPDHDLKEIEKL